MEKELNFNAEGRYRVAYEMALDMWIQSKQKAPNLEDQTEFLELVSKCTSALAYGAG